MPKMMAGDEASLLAGLELAFLAKSFKRLINKLNLLDGW
jgi:hypothetical protein